MDSMQGRTMTISSVGKVEVERLEAVRALNLTHTSDFPDLDAITSFAREIFGVSGALVTIVDEDVQWNISRSGYDDRWTPRLHSFCNVTLVEGRPLIVQDLSLDMRFDSNPLVRQQPYLRFYAGIPLEIDPGICLGTLCLIDTEARSLSSRELAQLERLATIATALLRQHRDTVRVARLSKSLAQSARTIEEQANTLTMQNRMLDEACALGEMGAFDHNLLTGKAEWSAIMKRIHDLDEDASIGSVNDFNHMKRFYSKRDMKRYLKAVREAMQTRTSLDFETALKTAKGRRRWVRLRVDFEYDQNGRPVRRFGMMQDITREKQLLGRLDYLANRDPLTGLYNRNYFLRTANHHLKERQHLTTGIAILDLDGFKAINDSYGHAAGDACLRAIATRLRSHCGPEWLLVRPGGDEFALVIADECDLETLKERLEALRLVIQEPIDWKGITFQVSASIGLAPAEPGRAQDALELVQSADLAVYKAKAGGRNCLATYSSDLHEVALHRFNIISEARRALDRGEFTLFYQPKIKLMDRSLSGFEALLRWRQPDGRYAAPGEYLPVLEDGEMSRRIGDFVMDEAIRQASCWRASGFDFGNIAINVSSSQFIGSGFVDRLISSMAEAGLAPGDIQIEVTEGVLLSTGATSVASGLKRLSDHGIKIAFDDFGTGYASLVHLRQLEFDVIKLDMSFVRSMLTSPADMAIVEAVLTLARRLGKQVVAEGVETSTQAETLLAHGCHYGQGYLFSRPKPAAVVEAAWRELREAV
jgi:diguanylate cyclase (GGDEF)-like protein